MKIHGAGLAASADFQAWRDERDWTARKYAMWETGERMPSQKPGSACRVLAHRVTFSLRHAITLPFWACVSWPAFRKAVADLNPGGGFSFGPD
jgi:hypothetical protein